MFQGDYYSTLLVLATWSKFCCHGLWTLT